MVDIHTHAGAAGALDQAVTFAAPSPGAYGVFVNVGTYADPRSPVPGASLSAVLPVGASFPLLSFPCGAPVGATVACRLAGYEFAAREQVTITYRVAVRTPSNGERVAIYRRTALTDAQGSFTRPVLRFAVDPRVLAYRVTVVVQGARGDHGEFGAFGTP